MKIATWNVNSIRARESRLIRWLGREEPDVVCLQELKTAADEFPHEAMARAGYHAVVHGQKRLNGVAILCRTAPSEVEHGMGAADPDPQARLVSARIAGLRVMSAYFPAGRVVGSDDFAYKLDWMRRLREHLDATASAADDIVLAGDFNVAPDDRDVANPAWWGGSVLCHESAREELERLREWGLVDVFRRLHPAVKAYSWWDYKLRAFEKDDGLRIDHIFATSSLASRFANARIDREERKGSGADKPSDHAPVIAELSG